MKNGVQGQGRRRFSWAQQLRATEKERKSGEGLHGDEWMRGLGELSEVNFLLFVLTKSVAFQKNEKKREN